MREVKNEKGQTQLWFYCKNRMTKSVKRMLSMRNINVEASSKWLGVDGLTCLHSAAAGCNIDICKLLIEKGANLDAKDSMGYTPLYWAVLFSRIEIVQFLCDYGASVEARDNLGCTPLFLAVMRDDLPIVKELIERKADINARVNGQTVLGWAKEFRRGPEMINYLISKGGLE